MEIKIGGVIEEVRDTDYIAGTIPYQVVCEDWKPYLPNPERQKRSSWDTMSCVTFSALNVLETQLNFFLADGKIADKEVEELIDLGYIVDGQFNFSERFTAVMSGTTDQGNSLQNVWDSIRHDGLLPEKDCPYTDTMTKAQYFRNDFTQEQKDKAKKILEYIEIRYEWLITNNVTSLADWEVESVRNALRQSPLQFTSPVCNWDETPTPCGKVASEHATMSWRADDTFAIMDHYVPFIKYLSRDYIIRYAMKAVATLKDNQENMIVDEAKLNQIYNEILFRDFDDGARGYIGKEENEVRAEVGKSEERMKLITLINAARNV